MSLFSFDEKGNNYSAEINGVRFVCEEPTPEIEKVASEMAVIYNKKLSQIVGFMMDDITITYGDVSADELTNALGVPEIDLDMEMITYLEHTLDDCHIIDVEYGGQLEEFYYVSING